MKKLILALGLVLLTPQAQAIPFVGDQSTYNVFIDQQFFGTLEAQFIDFDGTNWKTDSILLDPNGQVVGADTWTTSDADVQAMLGVPANCVSNGGRTQKSQVSAGEFPSCIVEDSGNIYAIAEVTPLFMAESFQNKDNGEFYLELAMFSPVAKHFEPSLRNLSEVEYAQLVKLLKRQQMPVLKF